MSLDRRTFLKSLGAAGAAAVVGSHHVSCAGTDEAADLVVTNGAIVTMNEGRPTAAAMAVKGGRILAVGDTPEVDRHRGPSTQVIDLAGRGVSPGLVDAHSHLIAFGHMELMFVIVRPPQVTSFESLSRVLRAAAAKKPAGEWIVARGFQEFVEKRWPRRGDLDQMVPSHPLLMIHWGGQYGIANTAALRKAGLLRADVKDPYGGVYIRDKRNGLPTGILVHYPAIYSVFRPEIDEEEQVACARWALQQFAREGVTCIHDNFVEPVAARTYVRLEQMGQLSARLRVYPYAWNLQHAQQMAQGMKRYQGPLVRMQGIKLAVDGYALMYEIPEGHKEFAVPMHPQEVFEQIVGVIHSAGLQVDVHAVGDRGVDWTLTAFEKAAGGAARARERRHRIEHFPFLKQDSIRRAAEMNVPVCEQPYAIDFRVDDFVEKNDRLTDAQIRTFVPLKTMLREGVPLAFGADVPAFPSHRPLDSIRSAMSRTTGRGRRLDAVESLSFMEALRIHTMGGAYAAFDEMELGSLEPGKHADFAIWNKDLSSVRTVKDIDLLGVDATYVGGRCVFTAEKAVP